MYMCLYTCTWPDDALFLVQSTHFVTLTFFRAINYMHRNMAYNLMKHQGDMVIITPLTHGTGKYMIITHYRGLPRGMTVPRGSSTKITKLTCQF